MPQSHNKPVIDISSFKQKQQLKAIVNDAKLETLKSKSDTKYQKLMRRFASSKHLPTIQNEAKHINTLVSYKDFDVYLPAYEPGLSVAAVEGHRVSASRYYGNFGRYMRSAIQLSQLPSANEDEKKKSSGSGETTGSKADKELLGKIDLLGRFNMEITADHHTESALSKATRRAHDKLLASMRKSCKVAAEMVLEVAGKECEVRDGKWLQVFGAVEVCRILRIRELSVCKDYPLFDVQYNIYNYPYFLLK